MVYTMYHQKEQSNYGLHCVIRRRSLIMVYTVCHQEQSMDYTVCHQIMSNYALQCVSSEGAV